MPDRCWQCGYDLSRLDSGQCPECGAGFPTGADVALLRQRFLQRNSGACHRCGSVLTDPESARCPTCGMRFAGPLGAPAIRSQRRAAGAHGVVTMPEAISARGAKTRLPPMRAAPFTLLLLAGLAGATLLVILANSFSGVLPGVVVVIMKLAALLLAGAMVGLLLARLLRRDVESLRGQLITGPRGWSHRVVGRCPNCGYDTAGLSEERCPECGLVLPHEHGTGLKA